MDTKFKIYVLKYIKNIFKIPTLVYC